MLDSRLNGLSPASLGPLISYKFFKQLDAIAVGGPVAGSGALHPFSPLVDFLVVRDLEAKSLQSIKSRVDRPGVGQAGLLNNLVRQTFENSVPPPL